MTYTLEQLKEKMERNGGSLNLGGCTGLTSLPDNLTVGGYLDLGGCTGLTSLPDNLTVGGPLDLRGCTVKNPRHYNTLKDGEYRVGKFIYCDGILYHVKRKRTIGKYTYYIGKIKGKNVVSDGTYYVHCESFSEGVKDLEFKACKERGAEQYKNLTLDSVIKKDDAIVMYRVITGACRQGTAHFLEGLEHIKEEYTIREIIELVKGQYGATIFIKKREEELTRLCEKYPNEIPIKDAADFLHVKPESLRSSISQGTCGFFAFSWISAGKTNRSFCIPTLSFYHAVMGR